MGIPNQFKPPTAILGVSTACLSLLLLMIPADVLAHGGHGDEFHTEAASQTADSIQVDGETAQRMGIKVEQIQRQRLAVGVKTTGQIETLPNQKVKVTAPLNSTVVELLVKPGDFVNKGQTVAVLSSPELAQLRVNSAEKRAEAQADLQLAKANYERQQQLVAADIRQAQSHLAFAQEQYDRDRELQAAGAIPRRQMQESETKLTEARAIAAKANSRLPALEAQAQLKRAQSAVEVAQSRLSLSSAGYEARLQQLGSRANAKGQIAITAPIAGTVADREITLGEAMQLYAQSLRGGEGREARGEEREARGDRGFEVPWWVFIPVGGAIAVAAFCLGRRTKPVSRQPSVGTSHELPLLQSASVGDGHEAISNKSPMSILASTFVALTLSPALCAILLANQQLPEDETWVSRFSQWLYLPLLRFSLQFPKIILVSAVAAFIASLIVLPSLGRVFLPEFQERSLVNTINLYLGVSLEMTNRAGLAMQDALQDDPRFELVQLRSGRAPGDADAGSVTLGHLDIELSQAGIKNREGSIEKLREEFAKLPGVAPNIGGFISHRMDEVLSGVRSAIAVKIFGPDLPELRRLGTQVRDVISDIPGVVDLQLNERQHCDWRHLKLCFIQVDPYWKRGLSYLKIGLRWLQGVVAKNRPLFDLSALPNQDPQPLVQRHTKLTMTDFVLSAFVHCVSIQSNSYTLTQMCQSARFAGQIIYF